MKQLFQENRNAFLLLLGLSLFLVFTIYFLFYRPLQEDLVLGENEKIALNGEITLLEAQAEELESLSDNEAVDLDALRFGSSIPDSPELEKLVLTFNEMELYSDSRINRIDFSYQGDLSEFNLSEPEEDGDTDGEESENEAEETGEIEEVEQELENDIDGEEEPELAIELTEIPEGLQPVILTIEMQSPDYEQFQTMLEEIESQERMMIISNLAFDKPGEDEFIFSEEPNETIDATVNVMTFYFES